MVDTMSKRPEGVRPAASSASAAAVEGRGDIRANRGTCSWADPCGLVELRRGPRLRAGSPGLAGRARWKPS